MIYILILSHLSVQELLELKERILQTLRIVVLITVDAIIGKVIIYPFLKYNDFNAQLLLTFVIRRI